VALATFSASCSTMPYTGTCASIRHLRLDSDAARRIVRSWGDLPYFAAIKRCSETSGFQARWLA